MQALMMDRALTLPSILEYAAQYHPDRQVVDRTVEGPIHRYGYAEALRRTKRMANALVAMGVKPGDRVATLAWSTHRHFELYFAVTGIGAVLHTINPRLHSDQIVWVANHAEDAFLFFDISFAGQVAELKDRMPLVKRFVAMTDRAHLPPEAPADALVYEDLIAANSDRFDWPEIDERQASGLCYTSGTTGNPKGVLYSHRSTVLHAMALGLPDAFNFSARDVVMPCAQMYHANAWCTPYAAPLVGATLVLPGRALDGASIAELIEVEGVTFLLGVPTIWVGVADHLDQTDARLTSVKTIAVGGSAPTAALVSRIEDRLGGQVRQIWGMTETSPLGVINTPLPEHEGEPAEASQQRKLKQGRGLWGVDMRIIGEDGAEQPRDGQSVGQLQVRGPWVASAYFKHDGGEVFTDDGWFDTGDIATLDAEGYLRLTDRAKDVIKSGGEWISTLDLEDAVCSHPAVAMAAAVGVPHPKWDERPLLLVTLRPGQTADPEALKAHVAARVAKWWTPDEVRIVDALPIGPTGKVLKRELRDRLATEAAASVT
ncbi:long-chain fatty acid--CoA ligase [Phenylobacterium sp.]|jgi:fatty-acyl-CoA synthase|uniref:long-chain fatty acid--CoA ligase n=1 Tax=Phenylobacterium sp. TaxID=1871053 RepID=UPI002E33D1F5|nr:long-chain fatty acid--CoA ligase [Phenylobacterium sp.]HEX3365627.1 long-chain fatty acid--CoA ligase [Phenylobacterium sp.]